MKVEFIAATEADSGATKPDGVVAPDRFESVPTA